MSDGTLNARSAATPVVGGLAFAEISAGFQPTCVLTTVGTVYCWGINSQGRLGDGTTTTRLVPTLMRSPDLFTAVEVGGVHSSAITAAGAAYCWGDIAGPQPANGTDLPTSLPKPVQLPGGVALKAITSGLTNTCVISTSDVRHCWGIVTVVGSTLVPALSDNATGVGMYALGPFVKCVLSTAGRLYCQSGNGDVTLSGMPKTGPPFPHLLGIVLNSIIAGDSHASAIGLQNDAYCWGSNADGRLGTGAA